MSVKLSGGKCSFSGLYPPGERSEDVPREELCYPRRGQGLGDALAKDGRIPKLQIGSGEYKWNLCLEARP